MKRRLTKLVVFLLLGAIVNVAVAWGCAWPQSDQLGTRFPWPAAPFVEATEAEVDYFVRLDWHRRTDSQCVIHKVMRAQVADHGFIERYFFEVTEAVPDCGFSRFLQVNEPFVVQVQAGWPLESLECEVWLPTQIYNSDWTQDAIGVVNAGENRLLPIRVVQSGFFVNTLFYAAILWLLTLGPFTARRMIRRKRGHCIKCGYDLRGAEHEVCPECGVEVKQRTTERS